MYFIVAEWSLFCLHSFVKSSTLSYSANWPNMCW